MLNGCMEQADAQSAVTPQSEAGRHTFDDTPALTKALRAGDETAYRWLYEQWHARLSRYCFALARGNDALAGDITQATYLRLVRHLRVLPDADALWSWLACAARSAAIDLGRRGSRYRGALARFGEWLGGEQANVSDEAELLRALDAALAQLTTEERDLINARYFEPVPLEQTAARLNTTARAVEGRLARLRQRLRDLIATELKHHEP
jgi:RNA polymerase sigma factor (sigma-70 family)